MAEQQKTQTWIVPAVIIGGLAVYLLAKRTPPAPPGQQQPNVSVNAVTLTVV